MGNDHISQKFDDELETIRSRVLEMGGLVEKQISSAIDSLSSGDVNMIDQIIEDDHRVNGLEVKIDEACNSVIARRQPTAGDMRLVMAVVKTITDLERIGDEAEKIARMARMLTQTSALQLPRFTEIKHAADIASEMLNKALDAFARLDTELATEVIRMDERVDEEFRSSIRYLITFMMEDPRTISNALDILFAAKAIERIGDHAKNIAEYVIYMVKGRDVRHVRLEEFDKDEL